ncbi:MAG TPA: TetR/AcrR family transcriptional regulator [Burkholderiales bacterium]|nr:TetR/AcrR family transcriptional regulator [Burkholderiales bacterium]
MDRLKKNVAIRSESRTRERLLQAAESMFMEHGYAATSLRGITARAKANLAAVSYHFGSKEALIREVFERRLGPLNSARVAYLDRLELAARGKPLAVERLVEAMLVPALQGTQDPLARGTTFLRLLGRAFSEPADHLREILPAQYRQVVIRFKQAFARSLPDMPDQELTWRMHFMFGTLSYSLAGNDALKLIATCNLEDADDADAVIRRLIPFLAAGFRAPLPDMQPARVVSGRKAA